MMKNIVSIKRFQFYIWTGAAWLLLWIFVSLIETPETLALHSLNEIWRVFYIVIVNFLFFEYSMPLIRKKRSTILLNILIGILLISIQFILISFGLYGWKYLGIQLHIYTSLRQSTLIPDGLYHQIMEEVTYHAQSGVVSIFFFGMAKLFYDNFRLKQTTQQLRLEKKEAELNYLKSQTNPHFLFNTLNNIYSLARDKSDLAPESILRLSKILRFLLYEAGRDNISIEEELKIISDYIALEKLRYDESLGVNLNYHIEDMKQTMPPLLLIPLIENAFKHGVSETRDNPFVDIHLSVNKKQLELTVKNSTETSSVKRPIKENIGLSNLRRQLELLFTDYNLSLKQAESDFTAVLNINLSTHV